MCIEYPHQTICHTPHCQTVLAVKKRNKYCPEALRNRRLGHCSTGVQVANPIDSKARSTRCANCLSQWDIPQPKQEELEGNRDPEPNSSTGDAAATAMAPATRSQSQSQGARLYAGLGEQQDDGVSLFDYVFAKPLEEAEAALKKEQEANKAGKNAPAPADAEEDEKEVFVVRTPEPQARRASARRGGRARGRARASGRGRASRAGTMASQAEEPQTPAQAAQGSQEPRRIPSSERLPYGFPAEGEYVRPLAPQPDQDLSDYDEEGIETGT
ncbi:hypothetical protein F5Y05DRAFT_423536 [Hypoxylon sp. FL0543]|nr:hypothetical protein F5Y05DRAFT_423536 [Hypoxylon sp. FL0543]